MSLKFYILFKFVDGPWGGGNQFLKVLRNYFQKMNVYSKNPKDADVILFNSYPFGSEYIYKDIFKVKNKGNKIVIHRVDGPISYIRGKDKKIDKIIYKSNELFADGTVFQSKWSMEKNYELGMHKSPYDTTIMNAPDPRIFNRKGKKQFDVNKVKLIATSWSGNIRKGFDIYKYLDEKLDFTKFEMTFVGNSPIQFKNIAWIKAVESKKLSKVVKKHDIFISASINEPCSNSLLEALHCSLPAVVRNDGGNPEILRKAGILFNNEFDVLNAINMVSHNYKYYQNQISLPLSDEIGKKYYDFIYSIYDDILQEKYIPQSKIGSKIFKTTKFKFCIQFIKIVNIFRGIKHFLRTF